MAAVKKVISFDVGGTLLSIKGEGFCQYFSWRSGISKEELLPHIYQIFLTKSIGMDEAVRLVCEYFDVKNSDEIIEQYQSPDLEVFDDVIQTLETLKEQGYTLITASNCTHWEKGLDDYSWAQYFDHQFFSCEIGAAKPNPRFFKHIESEMGCCPQQFIHIGDSWIADIEGAMGLGWGAVFINRRHHSKSLNPPVKSVSSLRQLPGIVDAYFQ